MSLLQQRCRGAGAREIDNEPRSAPDLAVDGDVATVALHDQLDHVEPETEAWDRLHRRSALERFEDLFRDRGIDAGPVIDDFQVGRVGRAIVMYANLDRLSGSVLDRVRKQVGDDLLESQRIELRVDASVGADLDPMHA